MKAEVAINY